MLARITAARRLPTVITPMLGRGFSDIYSEGSVAQSKGFGKKEKAHEDQYAREHEAKQLKELRKQIEETKAELAALEKAEQAASKE